MTIAETSLARREVAVDSAPRFARRKKGISGR